MKNGIVKISALLATLVALASCTKESFFPEGFDRRFVTVSFSAAGGVETKAGSSVESFENEYVVEDVPFVLSASMIQNTADPTEVYPMTKGAAVTTENLGAFTVDMNHAGSFLYKTGTAGGDSAVGEFSAIIDADGNKIEWPDDGKAYDFWAFNSLSANESYVHEGTFVSYSGVAEDMTAADMTDFVVAFSSVNHDHEAQNLVELKFYHALAAIRFNFDLGSAADAGFSVEKVEIMNVYNKGLFSFSSSATSFNNKFNWTPSGDPITYTYRPETDTDNTFYIIPQSLDDVQVVFTLVKNGKRYQMASRGNQLVNNPARKMWEPGYVYTYSVSSAYDGNVGIAIDEDFTTGGSIKNDVVVANTKRSTVYVRALIIANWCNDDNNPVYPCSSSDMNEIVASIGDGWVIGGDGFIYYTKPIIGYTSSDNLIDSFTKPSTAPMAGVHFELKVLAQAVECDVVNGNANASLIAAWGEVRDYENNPIAFEF